MTATIDAKRQEKDKWLTQLDPGIRATLEAAYRASGVSADAGSEHIVKADSAQAAPLKGAKPAGEARGKSDKAGVADDDKLEVAAQKSLGVMKYRGISVRLWAMTDPTGAIATGGQGPQADLAKMNEFGGTALQYVGQMNALEADWKQKIAATRTATAQSATDIKKVEAALPQMRERRRKDIKDSGNYHDGVDAYLKATAKAEKIVGRIRSAEAGLREAAGKLKVEELLKEAGDKETEVKDLKERSEAKQKEIDEAKRIGGEIFDIVEKVVKQEWSALATKALEFARDKMIDASVEAQYGKELADLKAKLDTAEKELTNLKSAALLEAVKASRAGVDKAIQDLNNARNEFTTALDELAQAQTHATDVLNKSDATKPLGAMLAQRAKQLHTINVARSACERYNHAADTMRKGTARVSNKYGTVGDWLNRAAGADPAFDRSKPYAKILEQSALSNAVELDRWTDWLGGVQDESKSSLAWLADTGASGPMVHFERAVAIAKASLVDDSA